MSIEDWREKVSTSSGCKALFQSKNFQTDLINALNEWHESSLKWIQNATKHPSTLNATDIPLNKVILLYRTIRNLSSIQTHSLWIIAHSNIISKITHFLCTIFTTLYDHLSKEPTECFLLLCDVIRGAFQMFCNLSFHSFEHKQHSMLWSHFRSSDLSSNYIVLWMEQWCITTQAQTHNRKVDVVIQTNVSRILEPICAFLHHLLIHYPHVMEDNESTMITQAMYHIQCIDVHYFGNNKNYLYEKVESKDSSDSSDSDEEDHNDDFDKWKHHDYIRKLMPYFIHANGLTLYISKLNPNTSKLYYWHVCIELLFEMTESILIDIKTPSGKPEVRVTQRKKIHLVQHALHTTFMQLFTVVDYAMRCVFDEMLKNLKRGTSDDMMLIRMCQHVLETMCNVSLISTSVENAKERVQYQNELMNGCGSIMVQTLDRLQNESEKLSKYCKEYKVSDDKFKRDYQMICEILSFRRPLISMVSTLCCKNPLNCDYVRENGVIEILLNMTKIDRFTLFLQQWSIFAIKNVTENSKANQEYIQSSKAEKVLENEEMKKLGIRITYDEITGKLVAKK
eukprot:83432_1